MPFSTSRAQTTCTAQIRKFGGIGKLRRGLQDRDCIVAILDFNPAAQDLVVDGKRRALVAYHNAAGAAIEAPDMENDQIVFAGEVWNIVLPILGLKPAGDFIFYDCTVQLSGTDGGAS